MSTQNIKWCRKILTIAVSTTLSSLASVAYADTLTSTTGILVDSGATGVAAKLITGGKQKIDITTGIGNAAATVSGASVWVEGVGNTINNTANISRTSTTGATYGVYLGDYSVARGNAANLAVAGADATSGAYGSTTMRITIPAVAGTNGLNATGLVGKRLVMAGVVIDGEAQAGDTRTIRSAVAVAGSTNTFDIVVDKAWARTDASGMPISQVGNSYNLIAGSGLNTFNNSGTVEAKYTGTATANIRGFETNVAGDYVINNAATGVIRGEHTSVGTPQGIDAGGDVTTMQVNNAGLITSIRTNGTITLTSNKFNALMGTAGGITNQSIGSAAAIYSQEELASIEINNTGEIKGVGDFNPGIYMRAGTQTVVNEGTISGSVNGANYGMGIGSVSDGGEIRTLHLSNQETGKINGAILGVNANAYRWYALSNFGDIVSGVTQAINLDNRLSTNNSNWGQLDATIENEGNINGKIYLSNGTHTITNTGTMAGDIDLDQRDTNNVRLTTTSAGYAAGQLGENTIQTAIVEVKNVAGSTTQTYNVYNKNFVAGEYDTTVAGLTPASSATATLATAPTSSSNTYGGLFTVVGTKSFSFENAGDFTGDILIHTASSNALGHGVTSEVTLLPHITGIGAASANAATSFTNIHGFNGDLIVVSTSSAGGEIDDVTIAPKVASGTTIRDGQFYKVANRVLAGTSVAGATALAAGATNLPSVAGNGLLNWEASINSAGALVIESEVNVANVAGVSSQGASALNALMSANSVLGSQVQNLADAAAVVSASEQIRPEVNNARFDAVQSVTDKVFGLVESRITQANRAMLSGKTGSDSFMVADNSQTGVASSGSKMSSGGQFNNTGFWLQGLGFRGNQDRYKNVDGYNSDVYGFALGADKLVGDRLRLGGALSYAQSNIDYDGVNLGSTTNIDSYQGLLYGSLLLDGWYLNGTLGLSQHDYESKRRVLNGVAQGSYDAWQYSARVDAGLPLKLSNFIVTPVIAMTYSYLDQSGYSETGLGALRIHGNDTNSFRTGLGAHVFLPIYEGKFSAGLELRGLWSHEFANTQQNTTASFVDGGGSFVSSGIQQARNSANLGGSLRFSAVDKDIKQSLLLSYDADIRDQYVGHTARLTARFDF